MTPSSSSWWVRAMPAVFIPVWSTGFIVARYGMPHAPPLAFLCLRYAFSLLCFLAWIAWARPAWPRGRAQWGHLAVTGALMHGGYLGGVWAAVIRACLRAAMASLLLLDMTHPLTTENELPMLMRSAFARRHETGG